MSTTLISCLNEAEECAIVGRLSEAASLLRKISIEKIPRAEAARAAQLFRRVGMFESALLLLLPIVRPKEKIPSPATAIETVECAVNLQRAGAIEEAFALLDSVPPEQCPESLLYKTILRFNEWDFRGGVHNLLRLINITPRDSYLNRLAQFHLASAFILEGKYNEAETMLGDLREVASQKGEGLMFFNTLELSTQAAVLTKNFSKAEQFLAEGEAFSDKAPSVDSFWILKWRSILLAYFKNNIALLEPARKAAAFKKQWEVVRELDFASCKIQHNEDLVTKLFFGSNYPGYRRVLAKEFDVPTAEVAYLQKGGSYTLKQSSPAFSHTQIAPALGKMAHNLLMLLLSDSYRGMRVGQLHNRLFSGEAYLPVQSLEKVQKVVLETRTIFEKQLAGLQISFNDGSYRLDCSRFEGSLEVPKIIPHLAVTDKRDYASKKVK